ncbi:hypothetical protein DFH06DRAFT_687940 [Mycena polygramma]|nr:hypothetical protein DFH06DRAFT_687940 [Mycena polygramma]
MSSQRMPFCGSYKYHRYEIDSLFKRAYHPFPPPRQCRLDTRAYRTRHRLQLYFRQRHPVHQNLVIVHASDSGIARMPPARTPATPCARPFCAPQVCRSTAPGWYPSPPVAASHHLSLLLAPPASLCPSRYTLHVPSVDIPRTHEGLQCACEPRLAVAYGVVRDGGVSCAPRLQRIVGCPRRRRVCTVSLTAHRFHSSIARVNANVNFNLGKNWMD